jgi:two-component system, LytTR family, sensor kinase
MKFTIDKSRFRVFLWIGATYTFLWIFISLVAYPDTFFKRAWNNIWLYPYVVVLNFIAYEYVFRSIKLKWDRLIVAPFLLFGLLMLYSFGFYVWRALGIVLHLYFPLVFADHFTEAVGQQMPYSMGSLLIFGLVRHVYDYRKLQEAAQLLKIQKQEAELNYLKSQTNPHFLFNTLNNIYSLARDKSDLAPESIMRLSKILRYMLYETSGDFISIEQELKVMDDYIALEKLRYDESLQIRIKRDVEDVKQAIPPLLLIPLVENAFKHGVSETRDRPFVDVFLSVNQRVLRFIVKNSSDGSETDIRENIGLTNLRRQLALLYTQYDLSVGHADSVFTANLIINLSSHVQNKMHHS